MKHVSEVSTVIVNGRLFHACTIVIVHTEEVLCAVTVVGYEFWLTSDQVGVNFSCGMNVGLVHQFSSDKMWIFVRFTWSVLSFLRLCVTFVAKPNPQKHSAKTRWKPARMILYITYQLYTVYIFTSILEPVSSLHSLLPNPRDPTITSRLRTANKYPRLPNRINKYQSFLSHALHHYQ